MAVKTAIFEVDVLATVLTGRNVAMVGYEEALVEVATFMFVEPTPSPTNDDFLSIPRFSRVRLSKEMSILLSPYCAKAIKEQHPKFTRAILGLDWEPVVGDPGKLRPLMDALMVLHGPYLRLASMPIDTTKWIMEETVSLYSKSRTTPAD